MAAVGYMQQGVVKNMRDGELVIKDGTGTPKTCTVTFDVGDFSIDEKYNVLTIKDRGILDHFRKGDEEPVGFSFSTKYTGYYGSVSLTVTPYEMLLQKGQCATGGDYATTSTTDGVSDVYTTDLVMTYTDVDGSTETITIADCACTGCKFDEGEENNTLAFTGVGLVTAPAISGAAAP